MIITIEVNARTGQAIGIKEDLALYLERYGTRGWCRSRKPRRGRWSK